MELNICVKNVGQGDTILIDWKDSVTGEFKCGLVDCNLTPDHNITPLIKYIEKNEVKEFEFVLLTHPHTDHFSGFLRFIRYCERQGIVINNFFHTSYLAPQFLGELFRVANCEEEFITEKLAAAVTLPEDKEKLKNLFCLLLDQEQMNGRGFIKSVTHVTHKFPIVFNDSFYIKVLSPNENVETVHYLTKTWDIASGNQLIMEQKTNNNPHANYLSTLLQISDHSTQWQILLCSDVNKETLRRIRDNENVYSDIRRRKTIFVQVPHHGSSYNHVEEFWDDLSGKEECEVVISAGNAHNHPGLEPVRYFIEHFRNLHCTNFVGGFSQFHSNSNDTKEYLFDACLNLPGVTAGGLPGKQPYNGQYPKCCGKIIRVNIDQQHNCSYYVEDDEQ